MKVLIVVKNKEYRSRKDFEIKIGQKIEISNTDNDSEPPELSYQYLGEKNTRDIELSEDFIEDYKEGDEKGSKKIIISREKEDLIEIIMESYGTKCDSDEILSIQVKLEEE